MMQDWNAYREALLARYAVRSRFPRHAHPGGEEILVLDGTFADSDARYPEGWYLRNPPGSSHQPFSDDGALIFAKLRQMRPQETRAVRVDTRDPACWQRVGARETCRLFDDGVERVSLQRLAPREAVFTEDIASIAGAELRVLNGEMVADDRALPRGGWLRLPHGAYERMVAGEQDATVYLKLGRQAGW